MASHWQRKVSKSVKLYNNVKIKERILAAPTATRRGNTIRVCDTTSLKTPLSSLMTKMMILPQLIIHCPTTTILIRLLSTRLRLMLLLLPPFLTSTLIFIPPVLNLVTYTPSTLLFRHTLVFNPSLLLPSPLPLILPLKIMQPPRLQINSSISLLMLSNEEMISFPWMVPALRPWS